MSEPVIKIRVEGNDEADSCKAAGELRNSILDKTEDVRIDMKSSNPAAQSGASDIIHVALLTVHSVHVVLEVVKMWREWRRDKTLIVENQHGHAVRVESTTPNAAEVIEKVLTAKA